jgi:hypothetical protein
MDGQSITRYLRDLCDRLDQGFDPSGLRKAAVAVAVPTLMFVPGCTMDAGLLYGAPMGSEDDCGDAVDNDYDGLIDCRDSDCHDVEVCISCFDGVDNDGDGLADCSDTLCAEGEGCQGLCADGLDNDGDEAIDCDDSDCAGSDDCP